MPRRGFSQNALLGMRVQLYTQIDLENELSTAKKPLDTLRSALKG